MTSKSEITPDGDPFARINVVSQPTLTTGQDLKLTGTNKLTLRDRIFMNRALNQSKIANSRNLNDGWGAKDGQTREDLQEEHKNNLEDPTKI